VTLGYVESRQVFDALGWSADDTGPLYELAGSLEKLGLVRTMGVATGGYVPVRPTYMGIVRATQPEQSAWQASLPELIEAWETTSIEFKRPQRPSKPT
jgi:hypothetical protein